MNIARKTALITGAKRAVDQVLVNDALRRGAERVYPGTRGTLQHTDKRVGPAPLDVTNLSPIQPAVDEVGNIETRIESQRRGICAQHASQAQQ